MDPMPLQDDSPVEPLERRRTGLIAAVAAASVLGALLAVALLWAVNDGHLVFEPRAAVAPAADLDARIASVETALAKDGVPVPAAPTLLPRPTMTLRIAARGLPTVTPTPVLPTATPTTPSTATATHTATATPTASVTSTASVTPVPTRTAAPLRTAQATATLRIVP